MTDTDQPSSIDDEAARWAVLSAYREMSAEDAAALEAWLSADRRHRGAYLRAQAGLIAMEDAVAASAQDAEAVNDNALSDIAVTAPRRRMAGRLAAGALAACLALVLAASWVEMPFLAGADEHRPEQMSLADGSTVTLGQGAQIATEFGSGRRTVILQRGEATFDVAPDAQRPFVVRAGEVNAEATGTVYSVKRVAAAGGTVRVREGTVLVWAGSDRAGAVALRAGEVLTLNPSAVETSVRPEDTLAATTEISLDNTTIAEAAARFNKVNSAQIIVEDPAIRSTRIVGLFDADDPQGFARAAAAVTGARVIARKGDFVIER